MCCVPERGRRLAQYGHADFWCCASPRQRIRIAQVVSVKGYSVEMEDGKRWNVSEITKCNEAELRKWKSMRDDNKWTEVNNEDKGGRCVGYWNALLPSDVEKKLEC
ncbi:hypothetical protein NDU88_004560 [Pleurodeles waltl]|uniref:Uncharacterized protein n=1 Tax=Pleurodeles waltl TaxID=8319 RepID=A0AAV7V511_PLEWA|nr:hypothetical protein NDU88_004560 [Pleurodeles waltl]